METDTHTHTHTDTQSSTVTLAAHARRGLTRYEFSKLFSEAWTSSMAISNIIAGFRVTGMYPLDREAMLGLISDVSALSEETGMSFIPMISPAVRCFTSRRDVESRALVIVNLHCLSIGITKSVTSPILNDRYSSWLAQHHPTSPAASHVWMQPLQSSRVGELLTYPTPRSQAPTLNPKSCGRIFNEPREPAF